MFTEDADDLKLTKRQSQNEDLVADWWRKFYKSAFHTLVPGYKWQTVHKEPQVGDIVLIQEQEDIVEKYKLARIVEARKSSMDGLIRKVVVEYKVTKPGVDKVSNEHKFPKTYQTTIRPFKNIALLVPAGYNEEEDN